MIKNEEVFRCLRCRAYVNPNFIFRDNNAICNLCKMINDVPKWFKCVSNINSGY